MQNSLVRIHTTDGRVVGVGFLVGERHILTCAHVVSQALDQLDLLLDPPQGLVTLDFPFISPRALCTARVVQWHPPQPDRRGDIAGLELQNEPPAGAEVVRFALAEDMWDHSFRAFGFPAGYDDGVWATGRLLRRQATGWVMIEGVKSQGFAVGPGFSGTPVWDEQLQGVVGMVVAATRPADIRAAFVIPVDVLVTAWPTIELSPSPIPQVVSPRRLCVFLCHSSGDKLIVRSLYQRLKACNVDPWLDEENLLPGQHWEHEIRKAVRATDVVIVCLSRGSISKTGFVQKEIKFALDVADEQPEGTIFLIPLRLEECELPERLKHLHWVNYMDEKGFHKLTQALQQRSESFREKLAPVTLPNSK